jgi:hypothetical protein
MVELPLKLIESPCDLSMFAFDEEADTLVLLPQDLEQLILQLGPCIVRRTLSRYCDWGCFDV